MKAARIDVRRKVTKVAKAAATGPLSVNELRKMDAYWRASNYLSVGQIYLLDNPLLTQPLRPQHIKPRLLGHWGTTPGLNFIYVHPSRKLTVEIGHYAFSSSWGSPGIFIPITDQPLTQMSGWQNMSFSELNDPVTREYFINAVRATVSRTDVPRFFSRIFASSDRAVSVQATAYIGFAGPLEAGTADIPIAICKHGHTRRSEL